MKNKFKEMFELQNRLNNNTNGIEWISGITNKNRTINWYRCIYMETAEAIDSLNWKHWKDINKKDDIENLKIEVVDIWHFIMSQIIKNNKCNIEKSYKETYQIFKIINEQYTFNKDKKDKYLINNLENLIRETINDEINLSTFFLILFSIEGFKMDDVYKLYLGKNCLNEFRQNHGYKDGTYIKLWNNKEDNVYMQNILEKNNNISFDELYNELETIYKTL
jgi:hypothetical protein